MKPYAIMVYSHVISLNEVIESKDLLDVACFSGSNSNTNSLEALTVDTKLEETNNLISIQNSEFTEENQANLLILADNKASIKQEKHIDESLGVLNF